MGIGIIEQAVYLMFFGLVRLDMSFPCMLGKLADDLSQTLQFIAHC